jgi:hypothetical protein
VIIAAHARHGGLLAPPAPPGGPTWPNDPYSLGVANWSLLNDYGCSANNAGGWTTQGTVTIGSDGTAPLSPPSVWQFDYPTGFADGVAPGVQYFIHSAYTAMYAGFWLKVSNPWQNDSSNVNKMLLFFDNYSGGSTFGSYWIRMLGPSPYHTYCEFEYGDGNSTVNYDENQDTSVFTLGVWHQVEFLVDITNNVLKWWVDGVLKGSYTGGLHFSGTGFVETHFDPIWGGNGGDTKSENDYYRVDHIHVTGRT